MTEGVEKEEMLGLFVVYYFPQLCTPLCVLYGYKSLLRTYSVEALKWKKYRYQQAVDKVDSLLSTYSKYDKFKFQASNHMTVWWQ